MNGQPNDARQHIRDSLMMVDSEMTANKLLNRNSDHFIRSMMESAEPGQSKLGEESMNTLFAEDSGGMDVDVLAGPGLSLEAFDINSNPIPLNDSSNNASDENERLRMRQNLRNSDPFVAGFELFPGLPLPDQPLTLDTNSNSNQMDESTQISHPTAGPPLHMPPPGFFQTNTYQQLSQQQQPILGFSQPPPSMLMYQQPQQEQQRQQLMPLGPPLHLPPPNFFQHSQSVGIQQLQPQLQQPLVTSGMDFQTAAATLVASLTPEQRLTLATEAIRQQQQHQQQRILSATIQPQYIPQQQYAFNNVGSGHLITPPIEPTLLSNSPQLPIINTTPSTTLNVSYSHPQREDFQLMDQQPSTSQSDLLVQASVSSISPSPASEQAILNQAPITVMKNSSQDSDSDAMIDDLYVSAKTAYDTLKSETKAESPAEITATTTATSSNNLFQEIQKQQEREVQQQQKLKKRMSFLGFSGLAGQTPGISWFGRSNDLGMTDVLEDAEEAVRRKPTRRLSRPMSSLFGQLTGHAENVEETMDGDDEANGRVAGDPVVVKEKSQMSNLKKRLSSIALSLSSGKIALSNVLPPMTPSPTSQPSQSQILDDTMKSNTSSSTDLKQITSAPESDDEISTTDAESRLGSMSRRSDGEFGSIGRSSEMDKTIGMPYICAHCSRPVESRKVANLSN
ncbi:UNVERIFIED_CONTAM: hypothetical protein HDU68_000800 [Siphonaria sp. JEL0065]|nr:hypothetical protein HDU68_000800 [Siphonaria sp. JEL0065]